MTQSRQYIYWVAFLEGEDLLQISKKSFKRKCTFVQTPSSHYLQWGLRLVLERTPLLTYPQPRHKHSRAESKEEKYQPINLIESLR